MKALLIAGGLGTRLRPLTFTRPKHLLPIANRPHVDHVMDLLHRHGVSEVVLLTSYLPDAFADVIARAEAHGISVEVTHEAEPLGTAGAIKNAEALIGSDSFLAVNGDVLTTADLTSLVSFHRGSGAHASILLTPVEDPSAYGVVPTDREGRVERFIEKPDPGTAPTNLINAGVYVVEPSVLDAIPAGEVVSLEHEVFPRLAAAGHLFAFPTDAYWMDIGTPEKYVQANLDALAGSFPTEAVTEPGPHAVVTASGTSIGEGAQVSSACIGAGCSIDSGALVQESVLLDDVVVASGARVIRSALGQGVRVGPGAEVRDRAVGDGEHVEA